MSTALGRKSCCVALENRKFGFQSKLWAEEKPFQFEFVLAFVIGI